MHLKSGLIIEAAFVRWGSNKNGDYTGADPGFQVRGGTLKKFVGVFRVKNHDFTTDNRPQATCFIQKIYAPSSKIFLNETGACGFYANKSYVF